MAKISLRPGEKRKLLLNKITPERAIREIKKVNKLRRKNSFSGKPRYLKLKNKRKRHWAKSPQWFQGLLLLFQIFL